MKRFPQLNKKHILKGINTSKNLNTKLKQMPFKQNLLKGTQLS